MGFFDYVADLYAAVSVTTAEAEERQYAGVEDTSGQQSSGKDVRSGGVGTAEHDRDATTRGGVSTKSPASGTDEESGSEKEANAADAEKAKQRTSSGDDAGGDAAGSAKGKSDEGGEEDAGGDDEPEEEEEEEEDEDEPVDPKPKLEEECLKSTQCHSLQHHYDECADRVQKQIDDEGKPEEDCIEEYFHMMHCATQCAAGKLFKQLR